MSAPRMDLRAIAQAGAARKAALARADDRLTLIADAVLAAGKRGNVKLAASTAGVDRTVLARRVKARKGASA